MTVSLDLTSSPAPLTATVLMVLIVTQSGGSAKTLEICQATYFLAPRLLQYHTSRIVVDFTDNATFPFLRIN